ncbi:L-2-hydroxyglutarate dehydrogenase, mitochondrial-like [Bradysia coprophila]|uniref:L-2-hydroxyglutarate dehydrogenase, mitochondrial-like n=1 Tax=Bradysia coprophila TaxID=38358 RepID=UPI00187DC336|nr:L-2-hydroxyglutarate dehydrogenase, mitochondrial-like [Bradysia coprophila]
MPIIKRAIISSSVILYHYRKYPVFCQVNQSQKKLTCYDLVVVGGGIVGVATARELKERHLKWKIAIVEKETKLAVHQSGHNSGVIHAGIYYKPGSLKAKLCVEGMKLMYEYLDTKNIPYKRCGKLIVATDETEVEQLNELHSRGLENKVPDLVLVGREEIGKIAPGCRAVKAIWSPHTGIVDYKLVTESYAEDFTKAGGEIHLKFELNRISEKEAGASDYPIKLIAKNAEISDKEIHAKYVLTCGGLYSDKLAEMTGCPAAPRIIPFRGEYLLLSPEKSSTIQTNIYPVPNSKFTFLGVHFTPRMDGSVWVGPNSVLALRREGYSWSEISFKELFEYVRYPGFLRFASKYWLFGLKEMFRSSRISFQLDHIQRFYPDINVNDLIAGPAGVRAQAIHEDGSLVDDFVFEYGKENGALSKRVLHCRNAPSPGATSSLAIAKMISDKVDMDFQI